MLCQLNASKTQFCPAGGLGTILLLDPVGHVNGCEAYGRWVPLEMPVALFGVIIIACLLRPRWANDMFVVPVICLDPLYPGLPTEEKISRVAAAGFTRVEFWGWRDKNIPAIQAACRENGVRVANFSGHRVGSPVAAATHQTLFADVTDAVATARVLGCQALMLLTNAFNPDGSVADRFEEVPDDLKFKNTVAALGELDRIVPDDITLLLEPLNTLVDHPGYYLSDMDTSSKIVREVASPRLKILCDLYHFGVMGADLKGIVTEHLALIGHLHIADVPGRHEPGTGSVDWAAMLRLIKSLDYSGGVGFEFFPQGDADAALKAIHDLWAENVATP
jgi:hydroxypyruvate isomerase